MSYIIYIVVYSYDKRNFISRRFVQVLWILDHLKDNFIDLIIKILLWIYKVNVLYIKMTRNCYDFNVERLKRHWILVFLRSTAQLVSRWFSKKGVAIHFRNTHLWTLRSLHGPFVLINRENFSDGLSRSRAKLSTTSVPRSNDRRSSRYNSIRFKPTCLSR